MPLCNSYNKMFVLWLIVHTLWNQFLLELSLNLFSILQICYRHIEDVHEEVWCWKNICWQTYRAFNLAILRWLHLVNIGWQCILCVKSTSLRAFTESFQHSADMLQTYWRYAWRSLMLKKYLLTNLAFNLAILRWLNLVNNGWQCILCEIKSS